MMLGYYHERRARGEKINIVYNWTDWIVSVTNISNMENNKLDI